MTYKVRNTTFGELEIGSAFETESGSRWFKRSLKTAVGQKANQGPLGRNWDYFKSDDPVRGEVKDSS